MSGLVPESYKAAGVDVVAGREFVERITSAVRSTHSPNVLPNFGSFAGMFDVSFLKDYRAPLLVSGTDGVGTKLHLASLLDQHEGVGIDLVAMCANDILACGARALFFLDYIACGKLDPIQMAAIVESIAEGCRQAGAALVGGETAEHPGTMRPDEYDLAGFVVGAVEKDQVISGQHVRPGDAIIGVPSTGIHSNGTSLIRKLFLKDGQTLPDNSDDIEFLRHEIMTPTAIYEPILRPLLGDQSPVLGMAHITGGGFYENIPRAFGKDLAAELDRGALQPAALFKRIQERGDLDLDEMYGVFNMGVGMALMVRSEDAPDVIAVLESQLAGAAFEVLGEARVIGRVVQRSADQASVRFS